MAILVMTLFFLNIKESLHLFLNFFAEKILDLRMFHLLQ